MIVALWAGMAMVLQDILAVCMCQLENRGRGWRAGGFDAAAWLCALATNHYALNSVNSHNTGLKVAVVVAVTVANVIGTKTGQVIGDRFFPDTTPPPRGWWSCPWCRTVTAGAACVTCGGPRITHPVPPGLQKAGE